jgi:hypothetical protein
VGSIGRRREREGEREREREREREQQKINVVRDRVLDRIVNWRGSEMAVR